jgi:cap1 methyltransferase
MDFTPMLCEIPNLSNISVKKLFPGELYECDEQEILTPTKTNLELSLNLISSLKNPINKNIQDMLYTKRKNLHELLKNNNQIKYAINRIQPFFKIQSIFKLDGSVKLANMDAIFHLIPQTNDILAYQRKDGILNFGAVAEGPGGFTEYLQYRYPISNVIGMSLKEPKELSWNMNVINPEHFIDVLGNDFTGNILTCYNDYINYVKSRYTSGLDFICADASVESENALSKLLLIESFICLSCIKLNRSIVIRLDDTFTTFTSHLLFLLSSCFQKTFIFKPCTAEQHTSEKYFIGKHALPKKDEVIMLIEKIISEWKPNQYFDKLIDESLSPKFKLYNEKLYKLNNIFVNNEIIELEKTLKYLEGNISKIPLYDIRKAPIIWNLP